VGEGKIESAGVELVQGRKRLAEFLFFEAGEQKKISRG